MSGGTFDYCEFRLDDAIQTIEQRIHENRKTVKQLWDEKSEDERQSASSWEKPWTILDHPWYVEDNAGDEAYKAVGVDPHSSFSNLSKKQKNLWNKVRRESIARQINEQNNAYLHMEFSNETAEAMKKMVETVKRARIYLHRIDYLLAGDDGEDNFLTRVKEDLEKEGLESDIA